VEVKTMGLMEERIAKQIVEKVGKELGNKFQNEFDKIGAEFKRIVEYLNGLDARITKIEKVLGEKEK
jgi:hypothetical protein